MSTSAATDSLEPMKRVLSALTEDCILAWGHLVAWKDVVEFFSAREQLRDKMSGYVAITLKAQVEALVMSISRILEDPSISQSGANLGHLLNLILNRHLRPVLALARPRHSALRDKDHLAKILHHDQVVVSDWRGKLDHLIQWRHKRIAHLDKASLELDQRPVYSADTKEVADCVKSLFTILSRYNAFVTNALVIGTTPGHSDFRVTADLLVGADEYRRRWLTAQEAVDIAYIRGAEGRPQGTTPTTMEEITVCWPPLQAPWDWDGRPLEPAIPPGL